MPSFVVFSSLTERSTWWVRSTSPIRTGVWNSIVLSVMTASGRPKRSLRSKCTCSGSASSVRPGAQWWGRNQTETMDGGAIGPPVRASATSSSQKSGLPFSTEAHDVQT